MQYISRMCLRKCDKINALSHKIILDDLTVNLYLTGYD